MTKPLLVVMAGGTGGHVFPGLAVATHMRDKGWQVEWMGTSDKMEAQLVPKHGFTIHFIHISGLRGKSLLQKLLAPFRLLGAIFQALLLLTKRKPKAVLGMGGYASGPGGIAAWILRIPLVVHEQNAVFGMTNRYLAKLARYTLTGFDLAPLARFHKKAGAVGVTHYVGNPIRANFFDIRTKPQSDSDTIHILIVGGSLGAQALNEIVPTVLAILSEKVALDVKHQSGKDKHVQVEQSYQSYQSLHNAEVIEFIDDMHSAFAWADIIICRAGALTVAEVAGAGKVAIFVPLPIAVDDHQTANARYLSDQGAAILIPQDQLDTSLLATLENLCSSQSMRSSIAQNAKACAHKHATEEVAGFIEKAANLIVGPTDNATVNATVNASSKSTAKENHLKGHSE